MVENDARWPYVAACNIYCSLSGIRSISNEYVKHMLLQEGHLFEANGKCLLCIQQARMEGGEVLHQEHLNCPLLLCCV